VKIARINQLANASAIITKIGAKGTGQGRRKVGHSLKDKRKEFQSTGAFYTPEPIARYMKSFLPDKLQEVYDPTCGRGDLLKIFSDDVKKYGQEINQEELEICKSEVMNFEGACGDTLKAPAFLEKKFEAIIANPPYSITWEGKENPANARDERFKVAPDLAPKSKADWAFILHILHYLSDTGTAAVLVFPGILYRGNAECKIRKWFIENNYIDTVANVKSNSFEDTSISTVLLVLKKNRTSTDVKFIDNVNGIERTITEKEIADNGFNLSISTYIQVEEEKEQIDIKKLNQEVNQSILNSIEKNLEFIAFMYSTFPNDYIDTFSDFLNKIFLIIERVRNG